MKAILQLLRYNHKGFLVQQIKFINTATVRSIRENCKSVTATGDHSQVFDMIKTIVTYFRK